jgi:hypothetical protein
MSTKDKIKAMATGAVQDIDLKQKLAEEMLLSGDKQEAKSIVG